jgi:hypothetical protein
MVKGRPIKSYHFQITSFLIGQHLQILFYEEGALPKARFFPESVKLD